ncbi:MAG: hypothetical protein WCA07_10305 [Gloeobacterales cyanobacterium]
MAHELDKDCEVWPLGTQVGGEYGSIVVKFEVQEKANDFIQKLGGLSYIQDNLQVESCDD